MRGSQLALRLLPLLLAGALASCTGGSSQAPDDRVDVVTTSTVFADLIARTGGEHVEVTSLVPPGVDVHTYVAKPADLRALREADLVVLNGLGLDDWLEETVAASGTDAPILRLAEDLEGVELIEGEDGGPNPHLWLDVEIARAYADRIAEALGQLAPDAVDDLAASHASYVEVLTELDGWVAEQIATIPEADRKLVMFHDAFPYFARAYGLEVVGVAVEAPGQDPSAGEIAALVDAIRENGVRAIFSEDQFPTTVIDQLARETGTSVVANLYDDSLDDETVDSYEAMIRWDVEQIVAGLR